LPEQSQKTVRQSIKPFIHSKREFNHDMEELELALWDLAVDNEK